LYLQVTPTAEGGWSLSWIFRYAITRVIDGKTVYRDRQMGLGPLYDVSAEQARARASELRTMRRDGLDPLDEKAREEAERKAAIGQVKTVRETIPAFLARLKSKPKHQQSAARYLERFVVPTIGNLLVPSVNEDVIAKLLTPIQEKRGGVGGAPTANNLRIVLKQLFDFAGHPGPNPASRAGRLKYLLADTKEVHEVQSHPALPIDKVPAFLDEVRQYKDMRGGHGHAEHVGLNRPKSLLALEFIVLLPVRAHQVTGMRWDEIKWNERKWICPKSRTKTGKKSGKDHVLPLSDACMAVLEEAKKRSGNSEHVFNEGRYGEPITLGSMRGLLKRRFSKYTDENGEPIHVHGFRTTFQSWAIERYTPLKENGLTAMQLSEVILGHEIHSEAAQAKIYARLADHTNPLRHLMDEWAAYCNRTEPLADVVVPIRAKRKPK
jgi:integrase